jgi:hypothetical protein
MKKLLRILSSNVDWDLTQTTIISRGFEHFTLTEKAIIRFCII